MRKLKLLGASLVVLLVLLVTAGFVALRGSLPRLDGRVALAGLSAPVNISRDARGVPTIEAATRADLAFATGFLSVPTLVHPVAPDHSSILITMFPLALIPTYLVPLSILLHVASLTKLARERSSRRPGDEAFHVAGPAAG